MNTGTAVITGASSGLGLQCARALLRRDASWHVVLAVRDPARGRAAMEELGELAARYPLKKPARLVPKLPMPERNPGVARSSALAFNQPEMVLPTLATPDPSAPVLR